MSIRQHRGAVLIVVLGVLVVLVLLATTFANLQRVERTVSKNYVDMVRAKLLAQAGVEHAVGELRRLGPSGFRPAMLRSLMYFGDDVAEIGTNVLLMSVPLEDARNPSLSWENESPQNPEDLNITPQTVTIEGQPRGFSRAPTSGTYGSYGDHYSLRVTDASGMIHINDGVNENTTYGSVSKNLKRMLNRLGEVNGINIPNLGDIIINNRPSTGYATKRQLLTLLGQVNYNKVAHCLTTAAWVDKNVIQPVPISQNGAVLQYYNQQNGFNSSTGMSPWYRGPSPGVFRYGHNRNYAGALISSQLVFAPEAASPSSLSHAIYGRDSLNPQYIEVCERAPVNVNTAPREVLVALLADIQGVWVAERRRNNPHSHRQWRQITNEPLGAVKFSNANAPYAGVGYEGDELGFLYSTDRILRPNESGSGVSPYAIADHIMACRQGVASTGVTPAFDYSSAAFGGWFKSWRQFNDFVDNLVEIQLLQESRDVFYVHPASNSAGGKTGATGLNNSNGYYGVKMTKYVASQAMADAIKANFNPNLHLNETNPDENMTLLVDKTDLIVNSTEFIFVPTGYWEIESLGRVLSPNNQPNGNALTASDNRLVAQSKISAMIKTTDAVRFTSQKDFWAGASNIQVPNPTPSATWQTNNGFSLEIGPEPDNGAASIENEWGGYIAFPTYGFHVPKNKGQMVNTPLGSSADTASSEASFHAHFTYDDRAHNHVDGNTYVQNAARFNLPGENVMQYADRTEGGTVGPYDPTMGAPNRHRLARGFKVPVGGGSGSLPTWSQQAPLDLRIDGLYMERDSLVAYWLTASSAGGYFAADSGQDLRATVSFWMKPSFIPEITGKPRLFPNLSRVDLRSDLHTYFGGGGNPFLMALFFNASQNPTYENQSENGSQAAWNRHSPISFLLCHTSSFMTRPFAYCPSCCYGRDWGRQTKCLNHHLHDASMGYPQSPVSHPGTASTKDTQNYYYRDNPMALGRWLHVACSFRDGVNYGGGSNETRIYLNGTTWYETNLRSTAYTEFMPHLDITYNVTNDNSVIGPPYSQCTSTNAGTTGFSDKNIFRMGQPPRVSVENPGGGPAASFNWAPDSTIDELAYFKQPITNAGVNQASLLGWTRGRYRATRTNYDGTFTSDVFSASVAGGRTLAPPSSTNPPVATGAGTPGTTTGTGAAGGGSVKVVGISWTIFGETVDANSPDYDPQMIDWSTAQLSNPSKYTLQPKFSVEIDGVWQPNVTNDYYSSIGQGGAGVFVTNVNTLRWRVEFGWKDPQPPGSLKLLATPYIDDVTIWLQPGDGGFLYYYMN